MRPRAAGGEGFVSGARDTALGRWSLERAVGDPAAFHARSIPPDPGRAVWHFEADRPALVLGSAQPDDVVDAAALVARGIGLVRRRSGGGAVLVTPGDLLWVDVVVPRHDRQWVDDVGRAFHWIGEAWAVALAGLGLPAEVHRGSLVRGRWGGLVCFGGLGPGEVTVEGRKVVGMAQRRAQGAARVQCAVLARWRPGETLGLLRLPPGERRHAIRDLQGAATGVVDLTRGAGGGDAAAVLDRLRRLFLAALADR